MKIITIQKINVQEHYVLFESKINDQTLRISGFITSYPGKKPYFTFTKDQSEMIQGILESELFKLLNNQGE